MAALTASISYNRPRHSRTALVTRPHAEAEALAAALAARGVASLIDPLIEIHFRDEPAPDLTGVQALLCTSANGVRAFARLSAERQINLLAVGDMTAARARAAGFARVESAGGNVADLARLAGRRLDPAAGPLLHICGSTVAGDLGGTLRARGFTVERAVLYEARPAPALGNDCMRALASGRIDVALFFSPRTAAIFTRLIERAGVAEGLGLVTAVSISAAANAALARLPFRDRLIAERPDQEGLLRTLDRMLAERRFA